MARPEHRFSKDLTKALEGKGALVLSIETGPTCRGIPDLYIAKRRKARWCELKVVTPHQQKDPRSAIQIKRQSEMESHGIRVLNAHDVRDSQDRNICYRLDTVPVTEYVTIYDLAQAIIDIMGE